MAYPTINGPYGLKPINLIGGQVYAGATRQMQIEATYATDIFYGDFVKRVVGGFIELDDGTTANTPVGVFLGCTYVSAVTKQPVQSQYYPASVSVQANTEIYATIADDPDTLFQVAVCSSGVVMATVTQNAIGTNMSILATAGNTATGNSNFSVLSTSPAVTNTFPVRVIDVIPATAPSAGNYAEVIVKINFGIHQYNNATGLAYA
jgi:hypothetical protein